MRVRDWMSPDRVTVAPSTHVAQARRVVAAAERRIMLDAARATRREGSRP